MFISKFLTDNKDDINKDPNTKTTKGNNLQDASANFPIKESMNTNRSKEDTEQESNKPVKINFLFHNIHQLDFSIFHLLFFHQFLLLQQGK